MVGSILSDSSLGKGGGGGEGREIESERGRLKRWKKKGRC